MSRRVRKSAEKKRTPRQVNKKSKAVQKKQKKFRNNANARSPNGCKMKRTIINEYAINKRPVPEPIEPVDEPVHSNNNMVDVESSEQFYLSRTIQSVDKSKTDGDLNIKITLFDKNSPTKCRAVTCASEENINNLNNLSITDVTGFLKNNTDQEQKSLVSNNSIQNQSEPIEILDTPTELLDLSSLNQEPLVTTVSDDSNVNSQQIFRNSSTTNKPCVGNENEIIVLDDTVQISDSDSDVEFVSRKRKSVIQIDSERKRLKPLDTIISITDEPRKRRKRRRRNFPRVQKNFNSLDLSPIMGGQGKTCSNEVNINPFNYFPLTSSTPNSSLVGTESAVMPCMCKGLIHSCVLKPNLETIPEENDKKVYDLFARGNMYRKNLQTCNLSPCKPSQLRQNFLNNRAPIQLGICAESTPKQSHQNAQNNHDVKRQLEESLKEYDEQLNVFGSNFLNAGEVRTVGLRPIFIDGSNVAMGHTNGKYFSVKGLKICIDYFKMKGHEVTAIVPRYRMKWKQNSDSALLEKLEKDGDVVFTPSRTINGKNIVPYDDRFLVLMAAVYKGIIVSSDNFRDLISENPYLSDTIENRVLNPTWMKDMIIFPEDPLGRYGPKLQTFLSFP